MHLYLCLYVKWWRKNFPSSLFDRTFFLTLKDRCLMFLLKFWLFWNCWLWFQIVLLLNECPLIMISCILKINIRMFSFESRYFFFTILQSALLQTQQKLTCCFPCSHTPISVMFFNIFIFSALRVFTTCRAYNL